MMRARAGRKTLPRVFPPPRRRRWRSISTPPRTTPPRWRRTSRATTRGASSVRTESRIDSRIDSGIDARTASGVGRLGSSDFLTARCGRCATSAPCGTFGGRSAAGSSARGRRAGQGGDQGAGLLAQGSGGAGEEEGRRLRRRSRGRSGSAGETCSKTSTTTPRSAKTRTERRVRAGAGTGGRIIFREVGPIAVYYSTTPGGK